MSLEHSPVREAPGAVTAIRGEVPADSDCWYGLIDERAAAAYLGVSVRTMQNGRQTGTGPPFVRLSARCIKYIRINLRAHAEARLVTSTSDPGLEAAITS